MAEVEAELVRLDNRALLIGIAADHLTQSIVEQVCRSVVAHDGYATVLRGANNNNVMQNTNHAITYHLHSYAKAIKHLSICLMTSSSSTIFVVSSLRPYLIDGAGHGVPDLEAARRDSANVKYIAAEHLHVTKELFSIPNEHHVPKQNCY
jgi:hypothetical protein